MTQHAIFGPVFALCALTFVVWTYMYVRRIHFLTTRRIRTQDLAVPGALARLTPAAVSNPSDNLKNLFEIPILFYAVTAYLYATQEVDTLYLAAAWSFVGLRALHSAIHCTVNIVIARFYVYFLSTLVLWFVIARAAAGWLALT